MVLCSCGNKNTQSDQKKESGSDSETSIEAVEFDKAKNCDEFIDQYEKWMDDYLIIIEKYVKNPMDQKASEQYMNVMTEAASWVEQWANLAACTSKEKYQKRFEEISEKADKKMKELGFD